jgi:hypothetical protein
MTSLEIEQLLKDHGWRGGWQGEGQYEFKKRYGNVWMEAFYWSNYIASLSKLYLRAPVPRGTSYEDWDRIYRELTAEILFDEVTSEHIDAEITKLIQRYKELGGGRRRKRSFESFWWRGEEGADAYAQWRKEVEETVLQILKDHYESAESRRSYGLSAVPYVTTHSVVMDVIENHRMEPRGVLRAEAARDVRAILAKLAKDGKIKRWGKADIDGKNIYWEYLPAEQQAVGTKKLKSRLLR